MKETNSTLSPLIRGFAKYMENSLDSGKKSYISTAVSIETHDYYYLKELGFIYWDKLTREEISYSIFCGLMKSLFKIDNFNELDWCKEYMIDSEPSEIDLIKFDSFINNSNEIALRIYRDLLPIVKRLVEDKTVDKCYRKLQNKGEI